MPKISIHHVQETNRIITFHLKDITFLLFIRGYQIFDHRQEIRLREGQAWIEDSLYLLAVEPEADDFTFLTFNIYKIGQQQSLEEQINWSNAYKVPRNADGLETLTIIIIVLFLSHD